MDIELVGGVPVFGCQFEIRFVDADAGGVDENVELGVDFTDLACYSGTGRAAGEIAGVGGVMRGIVEMGEERSEFAGVAA